MLPGCYPRGWRLSLDLQREAVAPVAATPGAARWRRLTVAIGLGIGCLLLFVGRQPDTAPQWQRELWNFGHVALFAGLAWVLLRRWRAPLRWQLPLLLVGTAVVGYAIELVQLRIGRDYSLHDVLLDVIGSAVGGWLAVQHRLAWRQRFLLALPVALACAAIVLPFTAIAWDSAQAARQFPRLATFQSPLELRRFQLYGGTRGEIRDGALWLRFGTAQWSGFTLAEPPADWRGYRTLVLQVDNPAAAPLRMSCRVDDALHHLSGFAHRDRFNRRFVLAPGASQLTIALSDIERAPRDRPMAMDRIAALGCFVHRQPQSNALQLRALYLE